MKDEQLKIITEQNTQLLQSLDRVEQEANELQLQKISSEEECKRLKDGNYELTSKYR